MANCAMETMAKRRFADGGEVKETPEQLIARMSAKYGTGTAPAEPRPNPPPVAAPPQAQGIGGLVGLIKGRQALIDKAANYANGGKIVGPGTPTSDSIPAKIRQTGEPIAVSTGERILSEEQDALMQKIAQGLGYDSLDALLEKGTGKPVGPTVKHGMAHAATGTPSIDLKTVQDAVIGQQPRPTPMSTLPDVLRSGNSFSQNLSAPQPAAAAPAAAASGNQGAAAKPTLVVPSGVDMAAYTPEKGINPITAIAQPIGKFFSDSAEAARGNNGTYEEIRARSGMSQQAGQQAIAAPSAVEPGVQERTFAPPSVAPTLAGPNGPNSMRASGGDVVAGQAIGTVTRSGNSFSGKNLLEDPSKPLTSINMVANNESMARANAIRQSILDKEATPRFDRGADSGVIRDTGLAESRALMDKWGREDAGQSAMNAAISNPKVAQAVAGIYGSGSLGEVARNRDELDRANHVDANATIQRGQDTRLQETGMTTDVTARGQDIAAQTHAAQLAGNPLDQALKGVQLQSGMQAIATGKRNADMAAQLDATTDPEKRRGLIDSILASQGKNPNEHRYIKVGGGEVMAPDGISKVKQAEGLYDSVTKQFIPMVAPAAPQSAPPGAVAMLKSNPAMAGDFDKKYGAGAAKQVLGT